MNRGYFADMKEFKEHGGKVMLQLLSLSRLFSLAMGLYHLGSLLSYQFSL